MNKKADTPLSNFDLDRLLSDINERANMFAINDITPDTTIEDMFRNRGHCILYKAYNNENSIGHWIAMIRKPGMVYYFDSLGNKPDKKIVDIIKEANYKGFYNEIKYQTDQNNCGRWAVLLAALNKILSFDQINYFLKLNKKTINNQLIESLR